MTLWQLFLGFLEVGFFSFGGAYSAIPLIRDVVLSNGWIDEEMLTYMIAVSESTPGPIMVNLATYVGSTMAGILGSAVATFAVVLPSFAIILLLMVALKRVLDNRYVQAALGSLKPCVIGIILATGAFMMWENCFGTAGDTASGFAPDWKALLLTLLFGGFYWGLRRVGRLKKKITPITLILVSAVVGAVVYSI